jgi:predicted RND superfamily exporter protein
MEGFLDWVTRRPKTVLAALLIVTAAFSSQLSKLRLQVSGRSLIPENHPTVLFDNEVQETFGLRETILIVLINETNGILNPHSLSALYLITQEVQKIEGVASNGVNSIALEKRIIVHENPLNPKIYEIEWIPLISEIPPSREEITQIDRELNEIDIYTGTLVSRDRKAAAILIELESSSDGRDHKEVYKEIGQRINQIIQTGHIDSADEIEIFVAGAPVAEGSLGEYVIRDLRLMMPVVSILIALFLFLTQKSLGGILLPLVKVLITILWTLGLMALVGIPIFIVTSILPVILMAMGLADEIHLFGRYREERINSPQKENRRVVVESVLKIWKPILFTSLTTGLGFLSFIFTPIQPLQFFGLLTALGIFIALFLTLTFLPASLVLFNIERGSGAESKSNKISEDLRSGILSRLGILLFERRKSILLFFVLLIPFILFGISKVYIQDSWIDNFNRESDIAVADRKINERFYGTHILNVILNGEKEEAFHDPKLLSNIEALQNYLKNIEGVGGSISIVDDLKIFNQKLNKEGIPSTEVEVAQSFFLLSMSGKRFQKKVDEEIQRGSIQIFLNQANFVKTKGVMKALQDFSNEKRMKIKFAGDVAVSQEMIGLIVRSQTIDLSISLVGIFLLTALMFRSPTAGFFHLVPVLFAVLINFGVMGFLRIPLGVASSMFSCLTFGIGVDYAIHFTSRMKESFEKRSDPREALLTTLATTGKTIFANALVIIAGFSVLMLSQMPPNQRFGGLVALSMFTSFFLSITLLPIILILIKPRFIFRHRDQ